MSLESTKTSPLNRLWAPDHAGEVSKQALCAILCIVAVGTQDKW